MKKFLVCILTATLAFNVILSSAALADISGPVVQIDAGSFHNIALKRDGTVTAWGNEGWAGTTAAPEGLQGIKSVSAGNRFSIALKTDGTVTGWGEQNFTAWLPPEGLTGVTAIATGDRHSLALKSDGTITAWGDNNDGQANPPAGLKNVVKIAAGRDHSLAVKADGTVIAWGDNDYGQTNVPAGLNDVKDIAGGEQFSLALKNDGTVVMWGSSTNSHEMQPPKGLANVTAIAAGAFHALALKKDGTVVQWGSYVADPPPANLRDVKAISAGRYHSIALLNDGTLVTWEDEQSSIPVELRHKSANANLKSILIEQPIADLNPLFSREKTRYRLDVAATATSMTLHTFTEDPYATVDRFFGDGRPASQISIPLSGGPTTVHFTVTAEDGVTTKTYTALANQIVESGPAEMNEEDRKSVIRLPASNALDQIRQASEIDVFHIDLQQSALQPIMEMHIPGELATAIKQKSSHTRLEVVTAGSTVLYPVSKLVSTETNVLKLYKKQFPTLGSFFLPGEKIYGQQYYVLNTSSIKMVNKTYKGK